MQGDKELEAFVLRKYAPDEDESSDDTSPLLRELAKEDSHIVEEIEKANNDWYIRGQG